VGVLGDNVDLVNTDKKRKKKSNEGAELFKIVKLLMEKKLDPVIIFSFSKKDVEAYAKSMCKMDLTT
jgi:ATP-dependent RNA helicase DOB1